MICLACQPTRGPPSLAQRCILKETTCAPGQSSAVSAASGGLVCRVRSVNLAAISLLLSLTIW